MISFGDFDTKVSFQEPTVTAGSQGERIVSWTTKAEPLCKVERTVSESVADDNLESGRTITLTTYKIAAVSTRWRVLIGTDPYEISSIDIQDRMSPFFVLTLQAIDG